VERIPSNVVNFENWMKSLILHGKKWFLLSESSGLDLIEFDALEISPGNAFIGIGYVGVRYFLLLGNNYRSLFCLMAVVTLWSAVDDFCSGSVQNLELYVQGEFEIIMINNQFIFFLI